MASIIAELVREKLKESNLWNQPLVDVRKLLEQMPAASPYPADVRLVTLGPSNKSGVKGEWHIPDNATDDAAVIYFHGGGYCLGVYEANRNFVGEMAKCLGTKVFLLDYSLAPENPFPQAIEDALAAYRYIANDLSVTKIAFAGDSSGCGLALTVLAILRDNHETLPIKAAFMTPMVDCTHSGDSIKTRAHIDPCAPSEEFYIIDNYTKGNDKSNPLISPLFGDLSNLPPMLIHSADLDIFLSDGLRLHDKLQKSNTPSRSKVWEGLWHNFHMSAVFVPEAREALDEICLFLREGFDESIRNHDEPSH